MFGSSPAPSRVYVHSSEVEIQYDANTGRMSFVCNPPLEPLRVDVPAQHEHICLAGDLLTYERTCASFDDLTSSLHALQYMIPPLLSLYLPEPVFVRSISGVIGEARFTWIHRDTTYLFIPLDRDLRQKRIETALGQTRWAGPPQNRRLLAALNYLHEALRLRSAGASDWEFMSASILAWCKALEVLFGNTLDSVREQLPKLGYSTAEIESNFVPMLILRNHLDVAHARLAAINGDQLAVIYAYLRDAENLFENLLQRVMRYVEAGDYQLLPAGDLALSADEQKGLNRLVASLECRTRPTAPAV